MDKNKLKKLNGFHVIFLAQNSMVGVGLLSLPSQLSSMGYSQWWMPLLFGVIANITLIPIVWLLLQYKEDNIFTIHEKLLGKWIGKFVNLLFACNAVVFLSAITEGYLDLIHVSALPDRPNTGPLIIFFLLLMYIVHGGIKSIARFCIISFILTIPLVYFLQWGIVEGEISHALPFYNFTSKEFITGIKYGFLSMVGYEVILAYFPYIINQQKAFKHVSIGIWLTAFVYFLVVFVSVMYFSEWQLENILYPVLHLFKAVSLTFFERIDVIGIAFWAFLVLSTAALYLWVGKKALDTLHSKNKMYHVYIIVILTFIFVSVPFSKEFQEMLYQRVFYVKYGIILWPNVLIIIHLITTSRKKKRIEASPPV